MSMDMTQDVRYSIVSDAGREELKIYLEWINQNKISDSESSFIYFTIGRAGLKDSRHLFAIWEKICEGIDVEETTKLQTMRFFLNPTEASFAHDSAAGWFDFLPQVYQLVESVTPPAEPKIPQFLKISDNSLPPLHAGESSAHPGIVTLKGWGVGLMQYTITRPQLVEILSAYNADGSNGALTHLFSLCPQEKMIQYFMGLDENLSINGYTLKDIKQRKVLSEINFSKSLENQDLNAGGAEFFCLLYSTDMSSQFGLPPGERFEPQRLKLNISPYTINEAQHAVALGGELIHSLEYQGQPVHLEFTPNDYTYYGKLFTRKIHAHSKATTECIFHSNLTTGAWELSRAELLLILNNYET